MNPLHFSLLVLFSLMLSAGQVLFKVTAKGLPDLNDFHALFMYFLTSISFWIALVLYGTATMIWIFILKFIPLSQAYPFAALGFIFVPLASVIFFQEPINTPYILGSALIIAGLGVISFYSNA